MICERRSKGRSLLDNKEKHQEFLSAKWDVLSWGGEQEEQTKKRSRESMIKGCLYIRYMVP